jgi:hypothetical protein
MLDMRDDLAHAYPPASWRSLHEGVNTLLRELDRYIDQVALWATGEGILSTTLRGSVTFATSDENLITPSCEPWDAA